MREGVNMRRLCTSKYGGVSSTFCMCGMCTEDFCRNKGFPICMYVASLKVKVRSMFLSDILISYKSMEWFCWNVSSSRMGMGLPVPGMRVFCSNLDPHIVNQEFRIRILL